MTPVCAFCHKILQDEQNEDAFRWLTIGDNFLQAKYFDSAECNRFCSPSCLCRALSVLEIAVNENNEEKAYEYFG